MITIILLIIMYLAFISLGLPDSLLGVAWPTMRTTFQLPLDAAGLIAFVGTLSTIFSSFISGHIIKKLGTGNTIFISCVLTGGALFGYSQAPSYLWLILFSIPLGLGAGSVDTALNNYVALHFKSHHMNWLHSFWGVGATLGPMIMAHALLTTTWRSGYRTIAMIQLSLAALLFLSLPLWKQHKLLTDQKPVEPEILAHNNHEGLPPYKIKGVPYALFTFLFYCAVEFSVGLWGSSYLVIIKHIPVESAAKWIAMYYGGITLGRFLSGFLSFKANNLQMIRGGSIIVLLGTLTLLLPLSNALLMSAFVLIGLGLSPIFPAMIHETPRRFGKDNSQVIIGYQMGFAYIGIAVLPPLIGVVINQTSMTVFPFFLVTCVTFMFLCTERLTFLTRIHS